MGVPQSQGFCLYGMPCTRMHTCTHPHARVHTHTPTHTFISLTISIAHPLFPSLPLSLSHTYIHTHTHCSPAGKITFNAAVKHQHKSVWVRVSVCLVNHERMVIMFCPGKKNWQGNIQNTLSLFSLSLWCTCWPTFLPMGALQYIDKI